jgi:hypothetical protein
MCGLGSELAGSRGRQLVAVITKRRCLLTTNPYPPPTLRMPFAPSSVLAVNMANNTNARRSSKSSARSIFSYACANGLLVIGVSQMWTRSDCCRFCGGYRTRIDIGFVVFFRRLLRMLRILAPGGSQRFPAWCIAATGSPCRSRNPQCRRGQRLLKGSIFREVRTVLENGCRSARWRARIQASCCARSRARIPAKRMQTTPKHAAGFAVFFLHLQPRDGR